MNIKEKLVELVDGAHHNASCVIGCDGSEGEAIEEEVRYLIAHGVTVQELDGCEYCEEDNDGYRTMFGAFSLANPCHGNVWTINTWHCKPRQIYFCPMCGRRLPQPPKGELQ